MDVWRVGWMVGCCSLSLGLWQPVARPSATALVLSAPVSSAVPVMGVLPRNPCPAHSRLRNEQTAAAEAETSLRTLTAWSSFQLGTFPVRVLIFSCWISVTCGDIIFPSGADDARNNETTMRQRCFLHSAFLFYGQTGVEASTNRSLTGLLQPSGRMGRSG